MNKLIIYSTSAGFGIIAAFLLLHTIQPIDRTSHVSGEPKQRCRLRLSSSIECQNSPNKFAAGIERRNFNPWLLYPNQSEVILL